MARKKASESVESEQKEQEYTYEEIHNNKLADLAGKDNEDNSKDLPKEDDSAKEEQSKPVEEVKEEPQEEEVEFDPEQLKREAAEEAAKKVWEEATKKQQEYEDKIKQEEMEKDSTIPPWVKRGETTPKDYDEYTNWNVEQAKKIIISEFETREAAKQAKIDEEKAAQEAAKKEDENKIEQYNKMVDEQLEDLYANGKLPKIEDDKNPEDLGVKSRQKLFQTMYDVNQERVKAGKLPIYSVKEIFYEHYKPVEVQPAGADAPIAGGKIRGFAQQQQGEYSYKDIHNKDFRELYK